MPLSQHCKYYNNGPTIPTRSTLAFSSAPFARRRASTPHPHPTTLCLVLTIASTRFITFSKQSEATSNTTTHTSTLILAYLSLLCSMLGALSGALSGSVVRTGYQDQLAFVEGPGRPTSAKINQSHANAWLSDLLFQLSAPRWLIQRRWDCRELSPVRMPKSISSCPVPRSQL
ncbi:hypothetical protein DFH94DRAFT_824328 [Russula ochroleuca]|uniref:Uncharacterized protein n=1 Tax=Russula ochroleuca TaxID=152965 RepID=A0A9P5N0A1_9AGAM|nr:hypothetical protein DFH94DRAFT_824328 [Russula ochroleuca]